MENAESINGKKTGEDALGKTGADNDYIIRFIHFLFLLYTQITLNYYFQKNKKIIINIIYKYNWIS